MGRLLCNLFNGIDAVAMREQPVMTHCQFGKTSNITIDPVGGCNKPRVPPMAELDAARPTLPCIGEQEIRVNCHVSRGNDQKRSMIHDGHLKLV